MPTYDPGSWNTKTLVKINNCYNYATDKKNEPPPAGKPAPEPAEPGRTKKVTAKQYKKTIQHNNQLIPLFDYECLGVKSAAKLDGLKDADADGNCEENCWRVAVFVRRLDEKKQLHGDYHFVREFVQDPEGANHPGNYFEVFERVGDAEF